LSAADSGDDGTNKLTEAINRQEELDFTRVPIPSHLGVQEALSFFIKIKIVC